MKGLNKKRILNVLAAIIFIVVSINIILHIFLGKDGYEIFGYCNISALLLSLGVGLKSPKIITIVLISAIPAQFLGISDFFFQILGFGIGRTEELFQYPGYIVLLSTLLHGLLIPVSIFGIYIYGFSKKVFIWIFLYPIILLSATYLIDSPIKENVNCIYFSCDLTYNDALMKDKGYYFNYYYLLFSEVYGVVNIFIIYFGLILINKYLNKK